MGFQKPNALQYRKLMDLHGQALMEDERPNDVYSLLKLVRLTERIGELHASKQPMADPQMESFNAELNVQMFSGELQEWRSSTPDHIKNLRTSQHKSGAKC